METNEAAKIDSYFEEVRRQWDRNAEKALSRGFFALWQNVRQPRPFAIADDEVLRIQGIPLALVSDTRRVGHYSWDEQEMCPVLLVEGDTTEQRVLLMVQDGEPLLEERPALCRDDTEVTYGERLEVIYDVIDHVRRHHPGLRVERLRGRVFREALEAVSGHHAPHVLRVMRRMSGATRDRLLARAMAEFAIDERCNQLELPLAGSFAPTAIPDPESEAEKDSPPGAGRAPRAHLSEPAPAIHAAGRTVWDVMLDLQLLEQACLARAEQIREFLLPLTPVEILKEHSDGDLVLRVPVLGDPGLIQEGDRLDVVRHGNRSAVGELRVDLIERQAFYGRLRWLEPGMPYPFDGYLYAVAREGPDAYIAGAIGALAVSLRDGSAGLGATSPILGLDAASSGIPTPVSVPDLLDRTQARAYAAAVNESNPVVLVQGPPGTGKTRVLELVVRELCARGRRVLLGAPSNTATDNMCRRLAGLPLLRVGHSRGAVAGDVADASWFEEPGVRETVEHLRAATGSLVIAGTHMGLLRSLSVRSEVEAGARFDTIVFDEAGMARADEVLLCATLASRAVFFGDPMQLPPHPLEEVLLSRVDAGAGPRLPGQRQLLTRSILQWMSEQRGFPMLLMSQSYRCQNPRLIRFASTLFYDAGIRANDRAEYFTLPYAERRRRYPPATLRLYRTSDLPPALRRERLVIEGKRPGLENPLEAAVAVGVLCDCLKRYSAEEVTVISPYRRQVRLIRAALRQRAVSQALAAAGLVGERLDAFLFGRVATVDSFQGGESDVVIISYVRSNPDHGIGFVADPNRVNVTHTRARREMMVIADSDCLEAQCPNGLFRRMIRAFQRDGEVLTLTPAMLSDLPIPPDECTFSATVFRAAFESGENEDAEAVASPARYSFSSLPGSSSTPT
ncbi:MAG: AAA family ATPase [Lentisphaeria bacterium]|nr:AAA family ATPase [Lentisphaeria bacterium]